MKYVIGGGGGMKNVIGGGGGMKYVIGGGGGMKYVIGGIIIAGILCVAWDGRGIIVAWVVGLRSWKKGALN